MYQAVSLLASPPLLLPVGCFTEHLHNSLRSIKTFSCCSDQADCCNNYTPLGFWQLNAATWFLLLPEEYSMTTVPTSISGPQMRAALNVVVLLCLLTSMLLTALVSGVSSGLSKEQNHHFDHTT